MSRYDVMNQLAAANPVPVETVEVDGYGDRLRDDILRTPRSVGRRPSRRLVLAGVAAGLTGVVAGAAIIWPEGAEPAYAVTPQMLAYRPDGAPAGEVLNRLADRAERGAAIGTGRLDYLMMQSYYLHTAIRAGRGSSAVQVVKEERWLAPDGSGRAVNTGGTVRPVGEGDPDTVGAANYGDVPDSDQRYGPGDLSGVADLAGMSNDPRVLADQLAANGTGFGWSDTAPRAPEWYRRVAVITGIAKQQVVPPRLWAAMLRVLATTPGLVSQGRVVDRAGRAALAVSFDTTHGGRPSRIVLLFGPDTGAFLGEEHILTTQYGDGPVDTYLGVKIPAVSTFSAVLAAGKVDTDRDRLAVGAHK